MVRAALDGKLGSVAVAPDPNFGLLIPEDCPDVPNEVLAPRNTWDDKNAYDTTAQHLAKQFEENFKNFEAEVDEKVNKAAIHATA